MTPKDRRQQHILAAVRHNHQVTVAQLSESLAVSDVTVRRDLHELEAAGILQRVHGGALPRRLTPPEPPVLQRMEEHLACKQAIGREAAALVNDGEAVFLGSGSTVLCVARHLRDRHDLTVVTNALTIANELASAEGMTVVLVGGVLRASELSLVGHIAEATLQELRVDRVIVGIRAISLENGLTSDYLPEVLTDRAILQMSNEVVVVADHSKLGCVASVVVAPLERVATLVTDAGADPEALESLRVLGIRVIVAAS